VGFRLRNTHVTLVSIALQHAQAVAERAEVTHAMDTRMLKAWDLDDGETRYGDAYGDQGFDLESIAPQPSCAVLRWWRRGIEPLIWEGTDARTH